MRLQVYLSSFLIVQSLLGVLSAVASRRVKVINNSGIRSNNAEILPQTPNERYDLRQLYHERFTMTSSNVSEQLQRIKPFAPPLNKTFKSSISTSSKDRKPTTVESKQVAKNLSIKIDKPNRVPNHFSASLSYPEDLTVIEDTESVKSLNVDETVDSKSSNLIALDDEPKSETRSLRESSHKSRSHIQSESEEGSDENDGQETYLPHSTSASSASESSEESKRRPLKKPESKSNVIVINITRGKKREEAIRTNIDDLYNRNVPLVQINLVYPKERTRMSAENTAELNQWRTVGSQLKKKHVRNVHSKLIHNSIDYFNSISSEVTRNSRNNDNLMDVDEAEDFKPVKVGTTDEFNGRPKNIVHEIIYRTSIKDLPAYEQKYQSSPFIAADSIADNFVTKMPYNDMEATSTYANIKPLQHHNKTDSKCGSTEYWSECGIESSCTGSYNAYKCVKPQCVCKDGLWRDDISGRCVELTKCSKKHWSTSGSVWLSKIESIIPTS